MASEHHIGVLSDGRRVHAIDLVADDLRVRILDHGARLVSFRKGSGPNVCIASETLSDYEGRLRYAGPIIGPVINRIAGAKAPIGGVVHRFEANQDGRHTLHSGSSGAHTTIWEVAACSAASVRLTTEMADGQGGFPGNRRLSALYALEDGGLTLTLEGVTDAASLMNPGSHGVWNPDGTADWSALRLLVPTDAYLPTSDDDIPTGEIASVEGTVYDHRKARKPDPSLDHNFCFDAAFGLRARLEGQRAALEIYSDAPGLQAYAGGQEGIALEPQLWPDAPHNAHFPSIGLEPGDTFRQENRFVIVAD